MYNKEAFLKWVHETHPTKIDLIKDWFNLDIVIEDLGGGTAMDSFLVNNIKSELAGVNRFIETGTEAGSFILNFVEDSPELLTCEVNEGSYLCSKYRHQTYPQIKGFLKDSKSFLESIELKDNDVLFLDAHGGGYDEFNDNPLTHELVEIKKQGVKPIIYIHDFGIEVENPVENGKYWTHPCLDKIYEYRFDFSTTESGWKLDWNFIKNNIYEIYGNNYIIEYPPFQNYGVNVGWIKIKNNS